MSDKCYTLGCQVVDDLKRYSKDIESKLQQSELAMEQAISNAKFMEEQLEGASDRIMYLNKYHAESCDKNHEIYTKAIIAQIERAEKAEAQCVIYESALKRIEAIPSCQTEDCCYGGRAWEYAFSALQKINPSIKPTPFSFADEPDSDRVHERLKKSEAQCDAMRCCSNCQYHGKYEFCIKMLRYVAGAYVCEDWRTKKEVAG